MDSREELLKRIQAMSPEDRKKLLDLDKPRFVSPYMVHVPHPGPQQLFLTTNNRKEVLYGGSAGSGKSDALLLAAAQYVDVPGYSALILRRSWTDLVLPGAIMDRAISWWSNTDAKKRDGGRLWEFPSGARIQFGYLQTDADKYRYQGAEFTFIGFDELTQFPEEQYLYLFSRLRKPQLSCLNCGSAIKIWPGYEGERHFSHANVDAWCDNAFPDPAVLNQYGPASDGTTLFDVPLRVRGCTNPGGIHGRWVKERFIDPRTKEPDSLFIPAKLADNPSLNKEEYAQSLSYLNPVERARLLEGDWNIEEEGLMFQRHWFNSIDTYPTNRKRIVRYWDLAASKDKGDYTAGARVSLLSDGRWVIEDVIRFRKLPFEVEKIIARVAELDGPGVPIRMEQEPGSSGKSLVDHYTRNVLVGYDFKGERSTGPKEARAAIVAAAAQNGNVALVTAGGWNRDFLDEVSVFPTKGVHDDQVDAVSGAFGCIRDSRRIRIIAG
jgi:predicted phage terminase large subunit-like protein